MAIGPQVYGACLVEVGTGAENAYEQLGYTVDGVDINYEFIKRPYKCDVFLDATRDVQYSGMEATIKVQLIEYDPDIIEAVQAIVFGGTAGTMISAGALLVAQGYTFPVKLTSTSTGAGTEPTCLIFNCCYPEQPTSKRIGTLATVTNVVFHALIPHTETGTMAGNVLYTTC